MRADKKSHLKPDKKTAPRSPKRVHMGYSKKTALLEEAITQMNAGKYGRSSAALKELLNLDPKNMEARRLFATLHLRLGSLIPARQAFDSLINEAVERQDYWLAESLLREYLAAGPRCVPFIEKLGSVFEEKGDALEAVTEYGKAIDILLEDPDADHAQRPAQLYAKIRELAPASPVAFRLASFFNVQTGELIKTPLQSLTEVSGSNGVEVAAQDDATINGAMPSNTVDDRLEPAHISRTADCPVAAPPSEFSLVQGAAVIGAESEKAEGESHGPDESGLAEPLRKDHATVGEDRSMPSTVQVSAHLQAPLVAALDLASDTQCSIVEAPNDVAFLTPSMVGDGSVSEPPASTCNDSTRQPASCQEQVSSIEPTHAGMSLDQPDPIRMANVEGPALSIDKSESSPSQLRGSVPPESAPAPMSWDQIQDATIHMADAGPKPDAVSDGSLSQPGSMSTDVHSPAGSASTPVPMPWDQVQDTTIHIVDPEPESSLHPAVSVLQSGSMTSEMPAPAGAAPAPAPMSWDQVEDATIYIADAGPKLHEHTVAPSTPAPMPWDQVQDTTIHIIDPAPKPDLDPAQAVGQSSIMMDEDHPSAEPVAFPRVGAQAQEEAVHQVAVGLELPPPIHSSDPALGTAQRADSFLSERQPPVPTDSAPAPPGPCDQVPDTSIPMADSGAEPDTEMPAPAGPASVLVSMPWDQVQDPAIAIADPAQELVPGQSVAESGFVMAEDHPSADIESVAFPRVDAQAQEELVHPVSFEPDLQSPSNFTEPLLDTAHRADFSLSVLQPPVPTDSAPAPMPWDQVQDTTIRLIDVPSEPDVNPQASVLEPKPASFVVQPSTTIQQAKEPAQEAIMRLAPTPSDAASQIPATEKAAAVATSTDLQAIPERERPSATAASESPHNSRTEPAAKRGGFSWQSIVRAWKFGKHTPAEEPKPDMTQARSPGRVEASTPSELRPAEPTVHRSWEQAARSVVPVDRVPVDLRQVGGAFAASMGENAALLSGENVPFVDQQPVSDAHSLQGGDGKTEAPSTGGANVDAVPPTEHEVRLPAAGEALGRTTDTAAAFERMEAPGHSAVEVSRETDAYAYDESRPGEPAPPFPFPRDISELQRDTLRVVSSAQAGADQVGTRRLSVASESHLHMEDRAIEPDAEVTAPGMGPQGLSMAMPENGAVPALEAPGIDRDAMVEHRGSVASSLTHRIESSQVTPSDDGDRSHWTTGEVAVQVHRPARNTPQNAGSPAPPRVNPHVKPQDHPPSGPSAAEPLKDQDEWNSTGAAIRFTEPFPHVDPAAPSAAWPEAAPHEAAASSAAAAVEYLFASTGSGPSTASLESTAYPKRGRRGLRVKLARARVDVVLLVRSCFSTTRAIVLSTLALVCLVGTMTAMGVGAVALTWMVMEESPSPAFRRFTTTPVKTILDAKQNGYVWLAGFDAPLGPVRPGHQGQGRAVSLRGGCVGQDSDALGGQTEGSASIANQLFRARDPVSAIQSRRETIKGWVGKSERALARYTQWLRLPFEDWGYGQSVNLPCRSITFAHRLSVAEGLLLGTDTAMARLEADMEAWRTVLAQARTLPLKVVALQAVQDDAALASGFLMDPAFDVKMLARVTNVVRPLDPDERSLRWPMQSELVWASRHTEAQIMAERAEDLPLYVNTAALLPLPNQRRLNHYAEYFETASQMAAEHPYGAVPKRNQYIHTPPGNVIDYVRDPLENLIGLEPLPEWSHYCAQLDDLDARLRLVRLQAWLRRGPQDANLAGRIAKAGQDFYDPYTGFPMLVNRKKAALYSVGHDGRDQDADPDTDIVVGIPISPPITLSGENSGLAMSP